MLPALAFLAFLGRELYDSYRLGYTPSVLIYLAGIVMLSVTFVTPWAAIDQARCIAYVITNYRLIVADLGGLRIGLSNEDIFIKIVLRMIQSFALDSSNFLYCEVADDNSGSIGFIYRSLSDGYSKSSVQDHSLPGILEVRAVKRLFYMNKRSQLRCAILKAQLRQGHYQHGL